MALALQRLGKTKETSQENKSKGNGFNVALLGFVSALIFYLGNKLLHGEVTINLQEMTS